MIWLFSSSSFKEKWSLITMTRNTSRINTTGMNKQTLQHNSNVSKFRWIQIPFRQYGMWSFRNSCNVSHEQKKKLAFEPRSFLHLFSVLPIQTTRKRKKILCWRSVKIKLILTMQNERHLLVKPVCCITSS